MTSYLRERFVALDLDQGSVSPREFREMMRRRIEEFHEADRALNEDLKEKKRFDPSGPDPLNA